MAKPKHLIVVTAERLLQEILSDITGMEKALADKKKTRNELLSIMHSKGYRMLEGATEPTPPKWATSGSKSTHKPKKKHFSAETRMRMSLAQKKRWLHAKVSK